MRQSGIWYVFEGLSVRQSGILYGLRQSGIWYVFASLTVRHSEVLYVFGSISGVFVFLVSLSVKQSG